MVTISRQVPQSFLNYRFFRGERCVEKLSRFTFFIEFLVIFITDDSHRNFLSTITKSELNVLFLKVFYKLLKSFKAVRGDFLTKQVGSNINMT